MSDKDAFDPGASMSPSCYRQAFDRIRAEYLEMPGMRLTPEQVRRLSGVEMAVCRRILDDLVRAKFLRARADGSYIRRTDDATRPLPASRAPRERSDRPSDR
jgi:hypothetical protein